jgi:hypothetical protein
VPSKLPELLKWAGPFATNDPYTVAIWYSLVAVVLLLTSIVGHVVIARIDVSRLPAKKGRLA